MRDKKCVRIPLDEYKEMVDHIEQLEAKCNEYADANAQWEAEYNKLVADVTEYIKVEEAVKVKHNRIGFK